MANSGSPKQKKTKPPIDINISTHQLPSKQTTAGSSRSSSEKMKQNSGALPLPVLSVSAEVHSSALFDRSVELM